MDTDGHCRAVGNNEIGLSCKFLIEDLQELLWTLGIGSTIRVKELSKKNPNHRDNYRLQFMANFPVYKIARKLQGQKMTDLRPTTKRRYIVKIEPTLDYQKAKNIRVDCPTGTYLIGK